jgi:hypothetical protein
VGSRRIPRRRRAAINASSAALEWAEVMLAAKRRLHRPSEYAMPTVLPLKSLPVKRCVRPRE